MHFFEFLIIYKTFQKVFEVVLDVIDAGIIQSIHIEINP